ncbi:hypothetical protein M0811_07811 [Anaeramoeba ignava]|uniref:Uncharacterized protein n=1 Tax=Anaeramoeba ignava TaxID=1746090 RepID=A0A9Q0LM18_ANAIG|nr:hypothetical protein M0811_07811 [Anaeramoeba ignava]
MKPKKGKKPTQILLECSKEAIKSKYCCSRCYNDNAKMFLIYERRKENLYKQLMKKEEELKETRRRLYYHGLENPKMKIKTRICEKSKTCHIQKFQRFISKQIENFRSVFNRSQNGLVISKLYRSQYLSSTLKKCTKQKLITKLEKKKDPEQSDMIQHMKRKFYFKQTKIMKNLAKSLFLGNKLEEKEEILNFQTELTEKS